MDVRLPDGTVIKGVPEGTSKADLISRLKKNGYDTSSLESQQAAAPAAPTEAYGPIRDDIDPSDLVNDKDWLKAAGTIYQMNEGKAWEGEEADLAEYGLDVMGWFNYNLPNMGYRAHQLAQAPQEQKDAFMYLMDSYDNLEMSWGGVGRFFKGVLADPTTYVGLSTLGVGMAGKAGAQQATKAGLKEVLKRSAGTGVVAGIEGAGYAGVDNTIRQNVRIDAGAQEDFDYGQAGLAVGLGAGLGVAGGTALHAVSDGLRKLAPRRPDVAPEPPPEVTPNPTPTPDLERPDALPPVDHGDATRDVAGFKIPTLNTGVRTVPRGMEELTAFSRSVADQLSKLHAPGSEEAAVEHLRRAELSQEEFAHLERSAQMATDDLRLELANVTRKLQSASDDELVALTTRQSELEDLLDPVSQLDEAFSSLAGSRLRQRQEGLTSLRGVTIKSLMKDQGISKEAAEIEYVRAVDNAMADAKIKRLQNDYDEKIQRALDNQDLAEASRLTVLKHEEANRLGEKKLGGEPGLIRKINEAAVSNVFSTTTLLVNIIPSAVKTVYKPLLKAVADNPLQASTRRELVSTYSAMGAARGAAWRAAKAAFRYEQAILTRDNGRLLEGELAIKGLKGQVIRTIPRLLNASDEFLSQTVYQGTIAGRVAAEAQEEGVQNGLTGRELKRYIQDRVRDALKKAYSDPSSEASINTVMNKGMNLGYSGEKLAAYVQREIVRDPQAVRHGTDGETMDYVRDMLFKKQFSGTNTASKIAQGYERIINEAPIMRLLGQLFFRTPVRVFEEGLRLTPGVQFVDPRFIRDLKGTNGRMRQVRAQGEAMMSLAFAGAALTLYANGQITGDGAYSNWRNQRARSDSDLTEPYTIRIGDSTYSYRNLDPIATPLKIIANAFERFEMLQIREQQGEFIDKEAYKKVTAAITVGTGAVVTAIRDANLMAGIDGAMTLFDNLGDPEGKEGAWIKFLGEKLRMTVPNTLHKIARSNDPTIEDPATFYQMLESKLLNSVTLGLREDGVPKSYDVLGNVRQINDRGSLWLVGSASTLEERQKGKSEKELEVLRALDHISRQTGASFQITPRHSMLGKTDLRKVPTQDGKSTLFDRWQQYYRELQPEHVLHPIVTSGAPVGTRQFDGPTVSLVRSTISQLQDAAFARLMAEEAGVTEKVIQHSVKQAQAQAGFWDQ